MKKLTILVPAYNEEKTVTRVLEQLRNVELIGQFQKEIIVINDCSGDRTEEMVQLFIEQNPKTKVSYFKHRVNSGKGAALRTGIENATGDYIIVQDADLEYDPQEFNILLKPVIDGYADVVYGSRFMGGASTPDPIFLAYNRQSVPYFSK